VNESQAKLGPLQLRNFKATGYLGKVNNKQVPCSSQLHNSNLFLKF
jgi:hypothetical protein